MVEETKPKKCSALSDFNKLKDAKKTCLEKFSACKTAEDESIGLIHICNGGTTPVPPSTTTETTVSGETTTAAASETTTATTTGGKSTSVFGFCHQLPLGEVNNRNEEQFEMTLIYMVTSRLRVTSLE